MKINITGALKKGRITKKELADKLWPGKNKSCQYQNFRLLENGTTKTYSFDIIAIICESCEVYPNYLFGSKRFYSEQEVNGAYAKGFEDGNERDRE